MSRPVELSDQVFDFGASGTQQNEVIIEQPAVVVFGSGILDSSYKFTYHLLSEANNYIDASGTKYPTYKKLPVFSNVRRKYYSVGLNTDEINLVSSSNTPNDPLDNYAYQTETYNYYTFQKAIAILKETTIDPLGTIISNGDIKANLQLNDVLSFTVAFSRGKEVDENVSVFIKNTSGVFVPAVQNLDYDVTVGTIGSFPTDSFSIKILKNAEYRLDYSVKGYDSVNNPFAIINDSRGLIVKNQNKISYFLNSITSPYNNTITLPVINPVFNSNIVLSSNPFSTYDQNNFTIEGDLDITTGKWVLTNILDGTITTRTLDATEWEDELNSRCSVTLDIKNVANTFFSSYSGLGPHSLALPNGNYTATFKVTNNQTAPCTAVGILGGNTQTIPAIVWNAAYSYQYELQLTGTGPFTLETTGGNNFIPSWLTVTVDQNTKKLIFTGTPDITNVGPVATLVMTLTNCGSPTPVQLALTNFAVFQNRFLNIFNFSNENATNLYTFGATLSGNLLATPVDINPGDILNFSRICQYKGELVVTITSTLIPISATLVYPDLTTINGVYNSSDNSFTFSNINTQADNQALTIIFQ